MRPYIPTSLLHIALTATLASGCMDVTTVYDVTAAPDDASVELEASSGGSDGAVGTDVADGHPEN